MLYRNFFGVDPWREMDQIQREMNRLFETMPRTGTRTFPPINIWTNADEAVVTAELPGLSSKDINISATADSLTIEGSKNPEELKAEETYHRQERLYGSFKRTVALPFMVDADKVDAHFDNGNLTIRLPRAAADKPKHIDIKVS